MKRSLSILAAALFGAGMSFGAAQAQMGVPGVTNGLATGPVVGTAAPPTRRQAPPPALPGARTTSTEPAPMDRPPSDMRPTEALFDAVNRGDIASARDALSRGAELDAHNVLGLTPIELSIDLGRNDITFLLLSMRGGSAPSAVQVARAAAGKAEHPAKQQQVRAAPVHAAPVRSASKPVTKPAPVSPRQQYADAPGTPAPQAGFLGFGGTTTR